jgi:NAD(P)-dependent dehydrogenase (short-subunit alcohol dehydrogenase family)
MTNLPLMKDKVVLITGGTAGIGEVTARSLAGMGATTVIVGRNPEKTAAVAQQIRSATGNERVNYLIADLSSQEQVRKLVEDFQHGYDRLDVLVNNAGAIFMKRELSVDGIEMTYALNHLSYFLLTHLLLDMLQASQPARVINVSSEGHRGARLNFADLENERSYTSWKVYGQSKLANLYFTYGLAATLDESGVTANALHPGFVATNFGKSNGGIFRSIFGLIQFAAITPEEGAQTSIYLASSPEVEGVTGKYFVKSQVVPSSAVSYDMSAARKLWDCSLEMVKLPVQ